MNKVLEGIQGVYIIDFLDDLLIFSSNFELHLQHLKEVLSRIRKANLRLNPNKCEFVKSSVEYVGHTVNAQGISPSPEKVKAMQEMKIPHNLRSLCGFVGLLSYHRRYIPHFSHIADPLINLTKKNVKFEWDDKCQ